MNTEARAKTKDKKNQKMSANQRILSAVLMFIGLLALFLFVSLLSHNNQDPSWTQTAVSEQIYNIMGSYGAYFSDLFLKSFGYVSYLIVFILFALVIRGIRYFQHHRGQSVNYFIPMVRIVFFCYFLFVAPIFFALCIQNSVEYNAGGMLGEVLANELFFINYYLLIALSLFFTLMCLSILLKLSCFSLFERIGNIATTIFFAVANIFMPKNLKKNNGRKNQNGVNRKDHGLNDYIGSVLREEPELNLNNITNDESRLKNMHTEQREEKKSQLNEKEKEGIQNYLVISEQAKPIEAMINPDYYTPIDSLYDENELFSQESERLEETNRTPFSEILGNKLYQDDDLVALNEHEIELKKKAPERLDEQDEQAAQPQNHDIQEAIPDDILSNKDDLIHPFLQTSKNSTIKSSGPLPDAELLNPYAHKQREFNYSVLNQQAKILESSLSDFRINCEVVGYEPGPVITRFEIKLAPGIKASKITNLGQDLARSLSLQSIRVVEVIPGKPYVGIELPNEHRETVSFRQVVESAPFQEATSPLTIALGQDILGQTVVADLAKMPHLLVAGTTGSGKSVGVNGMILSILYKSQPEDVRFIMIDPKMLELSVYQGIPHLLTDVVTDMKDAANALNWCVNEMEKRYKLMAALHVRNIDGYNEKIKQAEIMGKPIPDLTWIPSESLDTEMPMLKKLPYIVVLVDEFADLMITVGKQVEELIARLAQKARAAGIHLVLATQRPSVDVITGLIKANIPTRIAFTVSSKIDSRTILDQMGAESLLGMGDMLYLGPNKSIPIRVHGAFVSDDEVIRVVNDWKARGLETHYIDDITAEVTNDNASNNGEELDPLFDQAVNFIIESQRVSTSFIQRKLQVGYNRAARIIEQMEAQGIISPPGRNNAREILAGKNRHDF